MSGKLYPLEENSYVYPNDILSLLLCSLNFGICISAFQVGSILDIWILVIHLACLLSRPILLLCIDTQVGAWRDRIIIFTGIYGPTQALIKSLLDSGAKAVICPSAEPEETQLATFQGSGEFNAVENGKFEIGDEEAEDEDMEPASPISDWEDSEPEKNGAPSHYYWDDDEEELSQFVCQLYDSLFQSGSRVDVALQNALALHRSLRYSCHLPSIM